MEEVSSANDDNDDDDIVIEEGCACASKPPRGASGNESLANWATGRKKQDEGNGRFLEQRSGKEVAVPPGKSPHGHGVKDIEEERAVARFDSVRGTQPKSEDTVGRP